MKSSNMGLFAIAAAIAFVGALWAGVPLAGLATALIFLACPLMMIFMMKGTHSGSERDRHDTEEAGGQHLHH
jgi:hypothetical protein